MAIIPNGRLRHLVTIQDDTGSTRNAVGETTRVWSDKVTAYCEIRKLSGRELIAAKQKKPNSTHKITMHYQPGLDASMRLKVNFTAESTTVLHIEDVDNIEFMNHTIVMLAREDS